MKKGLSIVIPILNENYNILILVKQISKYLKKCNYEIIFVDDNSTDDSLNTLKTLRKKNKKVLFFIHKGKRDLTKSCFLGINKSKFSKVLIMDGDLQHNPIYIPKMLEIFNSHNVDIVIGSRNFKRNENNSLSIFRLIASKFLIYILKIISNKNLKDPMSGFFLFDKSIYYKNKKNFYSKGYKILADFIYNIPSIKIKEIDIKFRVRRFGSSKMSLYILILLSIFILKKLIFNFSKK
tara:strand:- start:13 stop:723 length:711 start_codon:yes stop_codon:yes gene_type:complete